MRFRLLVILLPVFAWAMFMHREKVPIDRLTANVKAHFKEYQDQAEAHYLLGRLESLAFSGKADAVEVHGSENGPQLPDVPFWSWVQEEREPAPTALVLPLATPDLFFSSIEHYRQAIAINSGAALYHFSLGWMAEQGQRFPSQLLSPPLSLMSGNEKLSWRLLAIREYREAYRLSDVKMDSVGPGPVLAIEAGQALIATLQAEIAEQKANDSSKSGASFVADAERNIVSVKANLDRLNRLPRAITPLIFSTHPGAHLRDLLSAETVTFDLDGLGEGHSWPWLRPDTALLVWDPASEGHIVSGRQLFGTVTWWMFWKNGFDPLAALDDNGDGWLTGAELEGIGVWRDRNGNGISDAGEVTPAGDFGIAAVGVHADAHVDGVLAGRRGVILGDGRALTLFDWLPRSNGMHPAS